MGADSAVILLHQAAAARRGRGRRASWQRRATASPSSPATVSGPSRRSLRCSASRRARAGLKPADKIEALAAMAARGPQGADGRRRPQRRAGAGRRACLHLAGDGGTSGAGVRRRALPWRAPRARSRKRSRISRRAVADHAPEPLDRGALQPRRGSARHRRLRHAADRGGGDVGLLGHRHAQRAAGPWRAPVASAAPDTGNTSMPPFRHGSLRTVAA